MTTDICHLHLRQCTNSTLIAYSGTTVRKVDAERPSATVFAREYFIDTRLGKLLTSTHHYKQRQLLLLQLMMMIMTTEPVSYTHLTLPTNREV